MLSDYRDSYEEGKRHGYQRGLGAACDIAHACVDEVARLGKSSDGYRRAVFDITARLLEKMKEAE